MSITLSKGEKVSLAKAASVSLAKSGDAPQTAVQAQAAAGAAAGMSAVMAAAIHNVAMAIGWSAVEKSGFLSRFFGKEIDLDASCIAVDSNGDVVDVVFYNKPSGCNGQIRHSGDDRTGEASGDNELIYVKLDTLPPTITQLFFVITSYEGQNFNDIKNAYCRLINYDTKLELIHYNISGSGKHTAMVMCKLVKEPAGWAMQAIGANAMGTTPSSMFREVLKYV
ncbi:TerD family protein [bacterium]|nr:TerD family protein [bacterium]